MKVVSRLSKVSHGTAEPAEFGATKLLSKGRSTCIRAESGPLSPSVFLPKDGQRELFSSSELSTLRTKLNQNGSPLRKGIQSCPFPFHLIRTRW